MSELTKAQKIQKIKEANAKILAIINEEVLPHIKGNLHELAKKRKHHHYTPYPFFCYMSRGNDSEHRFVELADDDILGDVEF